MTPAEWTNYVRGYLRRAEREEKKAVAYAWLNARLYRQKDFPALAELLAPPVEVVELSDEEVARQSAFEQFVLDRLKKPEPTSGE